MTSLLGYLQSSSADYIAVSDCDVICGVDLSDVLEYHIAHKAGITLICTEHGHSSVMVSAGEDGRLLEATRGGEGDLMFNNMYIVNRELLIQLVTEAASLNQYSFVDTCLIQKGRELPIYCYRYDGFAGRPTACRPTLRSRCVCWTPRCAASVPHGPSRLHPRAG